LAILLRSVVVDYSSSGSGYQIFDGHQEVKFFMKSEGYSKFINDLGRIQRYWEFCSFAGHPQPNSNDGKAKIEKWAKDPPELVQDIFEEVIKSNDVMPENWIGTFEKIKGIIAPIDSIGPPTPRFP
jgi:hypothetical protein